MKAKLLFCTIVFATLLLVMSSSFYADDTEIEQYCEVTAQARVLSRKVTIDVDYGEERKFFSFADTRVKDDVGRVKKFNSVIDATNFMGQRGWTLVNAFPVSEGNSLVYHYVFKKKFLKSEVDKAEQE